MCRNVQVCVALTEPDGSHDSDHTGLTGGRSGTAVYFITNLLPLNLGTPCADLGRSAGRLIWLLLISEALLLGVDFLFL